ncbi:MAG: guanine deaminase [Chitinophagaceae bacterium]|nr:guanine deaminase [Oligoflexus sp.]
MIPPHEAHVLVRGHILHVVQTQTHTHAEDILDGGLLLNKSGGIIKRGSFHELLSQFPSLDVRDHSGSLLLPSFIDSHIHFPQLDMIGSCAEELLLWLENYTFPREAAFRGRNAFVEAAARTFVDELVKNGTTFAAVYSSSCGDATDVLFEEFDRRGIRGIIGKVSMDRHCPPAIEVGVKKDKSWTEGLIKKWHRKNDRLHYALTPRFAPSCTNELMEMIASVYREDASLYLQTHYAENQNEIKWVTDLFPEAKSYLDVYDSRGLLGPRTILGHSIHTNAMDEALLQDHGVIISHCPTSNLFLGSGLFAARRYLSQGQKVTLGTDVGAGTSFSQWQTMNEAYKVAQLRQERIAPSELFALATTAAAKHLGFDDLGLLDEGYSADYQVIDPASRPVLKRHFDIAKNAEERLAALIHFADDRSLKALYVKGQSVYQSTLHP